MVSIAFDGIGEVVATFLTDDEITAGSVVKLCGNGLVAPCEEGDDFCGVALEAPQAWAVAVQVGGFARVRCASALGLGRMNLTADGSGGVKKASTGGVSALVVESYDDQAVLLL